MDQADLRRFLFEDYVESYQTQGCASDDRHMTEWLRRNVELFDRHRTIYKCTDLLLNAVSRVNSSVFRRGKKIMFVSLFPRHAAIILESARDNQVFLLQNGTAAARLMTDPHIYNCPSHEVYHDLYTGIWTHDNRLLESAARRMKQLIGKYRPDVIVLNDDALPENRLAFLAARELGIPTVEIQHGVYQSSGIWPTGLHVDYVFVWGQYFAENYVKKGIRTADRTRVLGYPFRLPPAREKTGKDSLLLIYFGVDFEKYDPGQLQTKLDTVARLKQICQAYGISFVYRPHPSDDVAHLSSLMPGVTFTRAGETLQESIDRGDIFVSFNSTALIEAALQGKLSLQLQNYRLPCDNYQSLGACSRTFRTPDELESCLREIAADKDISRFTTPVDSSYISVPEQGPGKRFLELVGEITARR